jgi:hypothetical protein
MSRSRTVCSKRKREITEFPVQLCLSVLQSQDKAEFEGEKLRLRLAKLHAQIVDEFFFCLKGGDGLSESGSQVECLMLETYFHLAADGEGDGPPPIRAIFVL